MIFIYLFLISIDCLLRSRCQRLSFPRICCFQKKKQRARRITRPACPKIPLDGGRGAAPCASHGCQLRLSAGGPVVKALVYCKPDDRAVKTQSSSTAKCFPTSFCPIRRFRFNQRKQSASTRPAINSRPYTHSTLPAHRFQAR